MPHRADASFFQKKRPWSNVKDRILSDYLVAYLPKVASLNRPITLIDGFAGPGRFADGSTGSPLILVKRALKARESGTDVEVLCIEADAGLFSSLQSELRVYPFARAVHGRFTQHLMVIAELAAKRTVFLYVDPFAIDGLNWQGLAQVCAQVRKARSKRRTPHEPVVPEPEPTVQGCVGCGCAPAGTGGG